MSLTGEFNRQSSWGLRSLLSGGLTLVCDGISHIYNSYAGDLHKSPLYQVLRTANRAARESGLPGFQNGAGDAMKHMYAAGMLTLRYGSWWATQVMQRREDWTDLMGQGSHSGMDRINNLLGIRIGEYVAAHGGTPEDARRLCEELIRKALQDGNLRDWMITEDKMIRDPRGRLVELRLNDRTPPLRIELPVFARYPDGNPIVGPPVPVSTAPLGALTS